MTRGNQRERDRVRAANRHDRNFKDSQSQLKQIDKALSVVCKVCKMAFMCTTNETQLRVHVENRHDKLHFEDCFES